MSHDARIVANALLTLASNDGKKLTHMKVQKLVYYCHAWMLGLYSRPLLEQPIEAWQYGPVVPDLYHSLRRYGGDAIPRQISRYEVRDDTSPFDYYEKDLIKQVWDKYGGFTAAELSRMTHDRGTP